MTSSSTEVNTSSLQADPKEIQLVSVSAFCPPLRKG
jgi:hypothetical protein